MFSRVATATVRLLVLGLMIQGAAASPASGQEAARRPVLNVDKLTARQFREQLKTLPDDAVVERRGQRTTAGEIRAKMRLPPGVAEARATALAARIEADATETEAKFRDDRAQFSEQQRARVEADNTKARAELARLRRATAIEHEAAQLWQRSRAASPQERAQIDQRAKVLLQELEQAER